MKKNLNDILKDIRLILITEGVKSINLNSISKKLDISKSKLNDFFTNDKDLVSQLLESERKGFNEIFDKYDFQTGNAIDAMLVVSREISDKYDIISPAYSADLEKIHPKIYQKHFNERRDFIFRKIQLDLRKGITQGLYRSDLSTELISRLYMSRLMDIHNTDYFPAGEFPFETLFDIMFDSLIRSIATEEGLEYYLQNK